MFRTTDLTRVAQLNEHTHLNSTLERDHITYNPEYVSFEELLRSRRYAKTRRRVRRWFNFAH